MDPAYRLVMAAPSIADYRRMREESGLSAKTGEQAGGALAGSWAVCHAIHERSREAVGMGRVLGDGGWYFHIADLAVVPEHQRRGIGTAILSALLERVAAESPPGAFVTLLADPPGRRLYERHGFRATAPDSIGMSLTLA